MATLGCELGGNCCKFLQVVPLSVQATILKDSIPRRARVVLDAAATFLESAGMLQPDSIASSLRWMLWYMAAQVTWRGTPWRSPPQLQPETMELPTRPAVFDPDAEPLNILCMVHGRVSALVAVGLPAN